jgi:hypothetical protein
VRGDFLAAQDGYKPPKAATRVSKAPRVINSRTLAKRELNALLTLGINGSALQSKFVAFSLKFWWCKSRIDLGAWGATMEEREMSSGLFQMLDKFF